MNNQTIGNNQVTERPRATVGIGSGKDVREIPELAGRMRNTAEALRAEVGVLRDRLGPILRLDDPMGEAILKQKPTCPLAEELDAAMGVFYEAQCIVRDILTRLEL